MRQTGHTAAVTGLLVLALGLTGCGSASPVADDASGPQPVAGFGFDWGLPDGYSGRTASIAASATPIGVEWQRLRLVTPTH